LNKEGDFMRSNHGKASLSEEPTNMFDTVFGIEDTSDQDDWQELVSEENLVEEEQH
jgi:hypothetical protein